MHSPITWTAIWGSRSSRTRFAPQYTIQNTYQLVENINWTKGKHTMKFGFDGRNSISPQHFIQRERGDYDYADLQEVPAG